MRFRSYQPLPGDTVMDPHALDGNVGNPITINMADRRVTGTIVAVEVHADPPAYTLTIDAPELTLSDLGGTGLVPGSYRIKGDT